MSDEAYRHTQHGKLHYLLYSIAGIMAVGVWFMRSDAMALYVSAGTTATVALFGLTVHHLTVWDQGDRLSLRFGPLPLLRGEVPYREIVAVEPGRTKFIDGWGIHWVPGRGWTYNLWGFDCAELSLAGGKKLRIGTDDRERLVAFLREKVAAQPRLESVPPRV